MRVCYVSGISYEAWQIRDDEDPSKTILVTIKVLAFDFELLVSA